MKTNNDTPTEIMLIEFHDKNIERFIAGYGINQVTIEDGWLCGPVTEAVDGLFRYGIKIANEVHAYDVDYSNNEIGGDWQKICTCHSLTDAIGEVQHQSQYDDKIDGSQYRIIDNGTRDIVIAIAV